MKTIHPLLTAFLLAILPLIGSGAETIRRLPESEVVATEERQAAALNVGAVVPASHPRFPVETLADGRAHSLLFFRTIFDAEQDTGC
jgi:hypothetical protein